MQNETNEEILDIMSILNGTFDDKCIQQRTNVASGGGSFLDWFCFNKKPTFDLVQLPNPIIVEVVKKLDAHERKNLVFASKALLELLKPDVNETKALYLKSLFKELVENMTSDFFIRLQFCRKENANNARKPASVFVHIRQDMLYLYTRDTDVCKHLEMRRLSINTTVDEVNHTPLWYVIYEQKNFQGFYDTFHELIRAFGLVFVNELPYYATKSNDVVRDVYFDDVLPWHFIKVESEIAEQELRLRKIHRLLNIYTVEQQNAGNAGKSAARMKYKNKYYKIRTGARGGKYILVSTANSRDKKKIYI